MARINDLTMARGNRGLLVLAVLAGLMAALLVFVALAQDSGSGTSSPSVAQSASVVATTRIAAGTEITSDMVEVTQVPDDLLIPGAFAGVSPVVGEVARYPIEKGEQLTAAKVGPEVGGEGLGFVVPTGKRALSVQVEEVTAVGGNLLAGDRVDLYAMFAGVDGEPNVTYRVIQDVEVLAVAQKAQEAVPAADSDASSDSRTSGQLPEELKRDPGAATVTLAVDAQYVPLLICVQEDDDVGNVWLALRAFGEASPAAADVVTVPPDCS